MAAGALNGVLVAYGGLQPFIVTLGTLSLYRATALIYTGGNPIFGIPPAFRALFNTSLLRHAESGRDRRRARARRSGWCSTRRRSASTSSPSAATQEASHIAGVPVAMTKIASYGISGGLAAVAGLILVGRLGAADPTLGNLWELDAIAAAAIGGASLMGGKGSIVGTLLGAIILGSLRNGLTLLNVQAFYQLLATGLIILAAMLIDRATRGRE